MRFSQILKFLLLAVVTIHMATLVETTMKICSIVSKGLVFRLSLAHTARFLSLRTKIFVAGDENLLCERNKHQRFLSLTAIFNIKHARNYFSSLTTGDKIFVASDKNRTVCARL